jgi:hypothetical protein
MDIDTLRMGTVITRTGITDLIVTMGIPRVLPTIGTTGIESTAITATIIAITATNSK